MVTDMPMMKDAFSLAMNKTAYALPPVLPVSLIGYGLNFKTFRIEKCSPPSIDFFLGVPVQIGFPPVIST